MTAMSVLKKQKKATPSTVDDELETAKKPKSGKKDKSEKKASKKSKKSSDADSASTKKVNASASEIPSRKEIKAMKPKALDRYHATLPESLEGWDDLSTKDKQRLLIDVLHDEGEAELKQGNNVVTLKSKKSKANPNDEMQKVRAEVEKLSEEEADSEVVALLNTTDFNDFRLGGVLSVIESNNYIGDYANFREKVEAEFGIHYRKARYLVNIYNDLVESNIEWSRVSGLGWTKLKEISSLLTSDNVDEWIEKAINMTVHQLIEEVKAANRKDTKASKKSTVSEVSTLTFKLHQDQRDNVEAAIGKALEEAGSEVKAVALEHMSLEYLAGGKKDNSVRGAFKALLKKHDGDEDKAYAEIVKAFNATFKQLEL